MWPVSASASGFAGDEGAPRNGGRGGRADAGRGETLAVAAALRQAAAPALMITARATSARKRSSIWSSKRCSRQEGLAQRTTIWATTTAWTPTACRQLWGTRDWDTRDAAGPPGAGGQAPGPGGIRFRAAF